MKKTIFLIAILCMALDMSAEEKAAECYVLGFYNMDNFFDPYHDEGKDDLDFTVDGKFRWDEGMYQMKVHNMARVIAAMAQNVKQYPALLGVCEVENKTVLGDVLGDPQIMDAGYSYVLCEGDTRNGLDVALIYRKDAFKVESSRLDESVLVVRGKLGGKPAVVFVAHYPADGYKFTDQRRADLSDRIRSLTLEQEKLNPSVKAIVMADFNCNPDTPCIMDSLHVKTQPFEAVAGEFFNPFYEVYRNGYGTIAVRGELLLVDGILMNSNLKPVVVVRNTRHISHEVCELYGRVFQQPFMAVQDGFDAGMPLRSFTPAGFIGGYSDHFPVLTAVEK